MLAYNIRNKLNLIKMNENSENAPGHNKEYQITVNGRPHTVKGKEISYDQLVLLSCGSAPQDPNAIFTITYKRGVGEKPEGTMSKGDSVKLKEGMVFNVTATYKS